MTLPRRRVLLIEGSPAPTTHIARILRPLVDDLRSMSALPEALSEGDLLVVDYDALSAEDRARYIRELSVARRSAPVLLVSSRRCREDFVPLFAGHALTNLLAKDGEVDAGDLIVTTQKLLRRDIFGLEKYFAWGVEPLVEEATRSSDKERILRWAEVYLKSIDVRARFAELFYSVVEELVTNAIYNAPVNGAGERRYAHFPRTQEVALEPGEQVEVRLCCDGRRLGVAVSDPFGSISQEQVLDYLAKCFRRSSDQVDTKPGGAGLGLFYVFQALSHMVINIRPGERTEVIGLIDIGGSYKDFAGKPKSFNIFVGDPGPRAAKRHERETGERGVK
jgi:signal transduction histidine kinase